MYTQRKPSPQKETILKAFANLGEDQVAKAVFKYTLSWYCPVQHTGEYTAGVVGDLVAQITVQIQTAWKRSEATSSLPYSSKTASAKAGRDFHKQNFPNSESPLITRSLRERKPFPH